MSGDPMNVQDMDTRALSADMTAQTQAERITQIEHTQLQSWRAENDLSFAAATFTDDNQFLENLNSLLDNGMRKIGAD